MNKRIPRKLKKKRQKEIKKEVLFRVNEKAQNIPLIWINGLPCFWGLENPTK